MKISFIVPCYNEEPEVLCKGVADMLETLDGIELLEAYEIIVVDDGSEDYSYPSFDDSRVVSISHRHNKGYSSALLSGIAVSCYEWIAITDSDGTYLVDSFPDLIEKLDGNDMVIGQRSWHQIEKIRIPAKFILTKFASFMAGSDIKDLNSGMRIFRKSTALQFKRLYPKRFSFTSTITMAFLTHGYEVEFVPIPYMKRKGKSHINPIKDTVRFFSLVTRLTLYFNPLRFFVPISFLLILCGIMRGVRDILTTQDHALGGLALILFFMSFQVFFFGLIAEIINKK